MTSVLAEEPVLTKVRSLPAERLLAVLGGACALGFGVLAFLLSALGNGKGSTFGFGGIAGAILTFAVVAVFGVLLLAWGMRAEAKAREWSIAVGVFSLVLLIFGGLAGAIGGLLGLVAAGLVFVRELKAL